MDWSIILSETLSDSFSTILKLTYIIIPLLIFIECLKDAGWLHKISSYCKSVTKYLNLPGESAIGLVVGLLIGLVFGSGVILQIREEVKMTRVQLNTMFLFVGICHAIIEETALFTAIGAYGVVLLLSRFLAAIFFTALYLLSIRWVNTIKDRVISGKMQA